MPRQANDPDIEARPAAFDALMMKNIGYIYAMANRRLKPSERDDIIQETIAAALHNWRNFRGDKMGAWLGWQMRGVLSNRRRSEKANKRTGKAYSVDEIENPKHPSMITQPTQEQIADCGKMLKRLSRTREGRLLLRSAIGHKKIDLAAQRGVSDTRICQMIDKARAEIKTLES